MDLADVLLALHPIFSTVGIGALAVAVFFFVVRWRYADKISEEVVGLTFALAVTGIVASFFSGWLASFLVDSFPAPIQNHQLFARIFTASAVVALFLWWLVPIVRAPRSWSWLAVLVVLVVGAGVTGTLGGQLSDSRAVSRAETNTRLPE